MTCWGACSISLGGVHNYATLTVVRFLLGAFEAGSSPNLDQSFSLTPTFPGVFPGLVYFLTFWYRPEERSIRVAFILASATLANAFGGAMAYGIAHMDYVAGLAAWRWLFILEGIPPVVFAPVVALLLPDYPETSKWLSQAESDRVQARLRGNASISSGRGLCWEDVKATVLNPRLWVHYIVRRNELQKAALHELTLLLFSCISVPRHPSPAYRFSRRALSLDWVIPHSALSSSPSLHTLWPTSYSSPCPTSRTGSTGAFTFVCLPAGAELPCL